MKLFWARVCRFFHCLRRMHYAESNVQLTRVVYGRRIRDVKFTRIACGWCGKHFWVDPDWGGPENTSKREGTVVDGNS